MLYNQKAKEKGCYMVGACGLDCVPNDMGVVYARQKFDGKLETRSSFFCNVHSGENKWSAIYFILNVVQLPKKS